ncbi:hypothetical protein [Bacillus swezeyi]|uniref:hypothetical protein n=1 Tax=Bacillus swezeyi TaxID=1925020 RepID=UPI0027DDE8F1|nr:hypothetical protein [Bacillus swezeyi]
MRESLGERLLQAFLEHVGATYDELEQNSSVDLVWVMKKIYVNRSFADAVEALGQQFPTYFSPDDFFSLDDGCPNVPIEIKDDMDILLDYDTDFGHPANFIEEETA